MVEWSDHGVSGVWSRYGAKNEPTGHLGIRDGGWIGMAGKCTIRAIDFSHNWLGNEGAGGGLGVLGQKRYGSYIFSLPESEGY